VTPYWLKVRREIAEQCGVCGLHRALVMRSLPIA
jgi:hypothetical protein